MGKPKSRVTSQGQISVPADIRKKLGIGPGTVLEWDVEGSRAVVQKAGTYTFEDIHKAVFPDGPPKPATLEELNEAKADSIREKYARR